MQTLDVPIEKRILGKLVCIGERRVQYIWPQKNASNVASMEMETKHGACYEK